MHAFQHKLQRAMQSAYCECFGKSWLGSELSRCSLAGIGLLLLELG